MEQSKKQKIVEFLRVFWAVAIFIFAIFNAIYAIENYEMTKTEILLRFWKYWLIIVIIIAALEALSNRLKD